MNTEYVDSTSFKPLIETALALPPGENLRAACAAVVRALPQEAEVTRRHTAIQAAAAVRKLLHSSCGVASSLARSIASWMRVQESALIDLTTSFSTLDTADAVQAWSDAYAFASPEEDEDPNLSALKKGVRSHIVSCISAWCTSSPRSLFAYLPQLVGKYPSAREWPPPSQGALGAGIGRAPMRPKAKLSLLHMGLEDAALSVRLSAVRCVCTLLLAAQRGQYLQLADETSGRGYAFTSLSAQVALALISIRTATAAGVERTMQGPVKLALAYLDLAEVLISKVVKVKLKVPHRAVLAPALNMAVNEATPVIAVRAWDLLKMLGDEPVQPTVPPNVLDEALASLSKQENERHDSWTFVTALVGLPIWTEEQQLCFLEQIERASPSEGALRALWSTMQHHWPYTRADFGRPALAAIQLCLVESISVGSQQLAGQCAVTLLLSYQVDTEEVMQTVRCLTATSRPPSVRGGVFHTLGIEAQILISAPRGHTTDRVLQESWSCLIAHAAEMQASLLGEPAYLEMTAQMTWAMANMLEGPIPIDLHLLRMISDWVPLSERVGTNAVRAVGCLLSRLPACEPTVGRALAALALAVRTRTPKMRWNAAAAAQRALHSQGNQLAVHQELQELCRALASNLQNGGNAKVIRASAGALRAMPWRLWEDGRSDVRDAVRAGRSRLLVASRTGASARISDEALAELDLLEEGVEHG